MEEFTMTNNKWIKSGLTLSAALVLAACGGAGNKSEEGSTGADDQAAETTEEQVDDQHIHVGASNTPHAELLEYVQPKLAEEGIELEITVYDDYALQNPALVNGDVDANYFQHVPYFNEQIKENDYDIADIGHIHLEPIAAFSKRFKSLEELPDGATIYVSNNRPDHGRILEIFEKVGLLEIDDAIDITEASFEDIKENPHDYKFETDFDPGLMPTFYENDEADAIFINSNFAVDAGINILEENIAIQDADSPYANLIAVRSEDKDNPALKRLVELLQDKETQDYILEKWEGAVLPATD